MPDYITLFRGRPEVVRGEDELAAARSRIQCELMDERVPPGASYEVRVAPCADWLTDPAARSMALAEAGNLAIVDVAEKPGRGSTVARWATPRAS